jgi:hypothetical protein
MYLVFSTFISRRISLIASINFSVFFFMHVRWGLCHHSMVRPRVADGGVASRHGGELQNKQQRTEEGGPSAWGLSMGRFLLEWVTKQ